MHRIFLIPSSVDGHLGCFHVSDIANNASVDIWVQVSFQIMAFSRYMPRSGIAGPGGSYIWNLRTVLHRVAPIYIPPNNVGELPFIYTLSSTYHLEIFDDGHSDQDEVILHCSFDFHLSDN